jgi:Domain of unknown function (DUF5615)
MRFLIDASMPRATGDVVRRAGHAAIDVRDIRLGSASDRVISQRAKIRKLCILSRDFDFANIKWYPPERYHGIVVFELPKHAPRRLVLELVRSFIENRHVLRHLPGRLAIVDIAKIRLRPPIDL